MHGTNHEREGGGIGKSFTQYGCSAHMKYDPREKDWEKQRAERGFDDTEIWNLDTTTARFLVPRLKAYRESCSGYPASLSEQEWNEILTEMIEGFESFSNPEDAIEVDQKAERAVELLGKWFFSLWS